MQSNCGKLITELEIFGWGHWVLEVSLTTCINWGLNVEMSSHQNEFAYADMGSYTYCICDCSKKYKEKRKETYLKKKKKKDSTSKSNLKIEIACYQFCKCLKTKSAWVKTASTKEDTSLHSNPLKHLVC